MPAGTRKQASRKAKAPDAEAPSLDHGPDTVGKALELIHPVAKTSKRTSSKKRGHEDPDSDADTSPVRKKTNVADQSPLLPPPCPPPALPPPPNALPTNKPRKGRKAKVPDVELPPPGHGSETVDNVLEDTRTVLTGKHTEKRSHENVDSGIDTGPAKKKSRETVSPPSEPETPSQHEVQKTPPQKPPPNARSPLPQRDGRNEHPGARVAGKKRRTSAEVAAEKAAKEEKKRRLAQLEAEKRELLAQMEVDEDEQELDYQVNVVRRLSDVRFVKPGDCESKSEGEVFDLNVDSSEPEDVESMEADKKKKPMATKVKRAVAAATKKTKNKDAVGEGKRTTARKGEKAPASGLIPNWDKHTKATRKSSDDSKQGLGGLTDADADATKPDFGVPKEFQPTKNVRFDNTRDLSRRNMDVTPVVSEPEVKAEEKPITQKKPRPVKRPSKQEQSQPTQPPENAPREPRRRALNGNTVRVSDLPEFTEVDSKWRKVFIPSLYNAFFCSSAPFKEFVVGSTRFIRIVQEVVDCVYPEVKYTVKRDDAIHLISYNRINEKRSALGSDAIKSIKKFLKDNKEIRTWCRWAKRVDGPLFYSKPTPKSCPIDPDHKDYIRPEGRLQSSFIINLATNYLRLADGAINQTRPPIGLFALILAALERAVRGYVKGIRTAVHDFSDKFSGDRVIEYATSCSKVKAHNWQEILEICGTVDIPVPDEDLSDDEMADISLLDQQRGALFDFSSPVKG